MKRKSSMSSTQQQNGFILISCVILMLIIALICEDAHTDAHMNLLACKWFTHVGDNPGQGNQR